MTVTLTMEVPDPVRRYILEEIQADGRYHTDAARDDQVKEWLARQALRGVLIGLEPLAERELRKRLNPSVLAVRSEVEPGQNEPLEELRQRKEQPQQ